MSQRQRFFQIAGITYRLKDTPELATFRPFGACVIEAEPDNEDDPLALRVMNNGVFVGYIPGPKSNTPEIQGKIHTLIEKGESYEVAIEEYRYRDGEDWNDEHRGKLGSIKLVLRHEEGIEEAPDEDCEVLTSFNEKGVEVKFYPQAHQYWFRGRRLQSVTSLVSRMYTPFDKHGIAKRCEKSYGMKAKDIVALWNRNGDAAAAFGTAIHAALENYVLFGERGLPKAPLLRDVVLAFPWDGSNVYVEVLITDVQGGVCGLCDRLVEKDGVYSVQDYKVQSDVAKKSSGMKNLVLPQVESNKLGKHRCQMSIYAAMLAATEFAVSDNVVAHVFDDKWTYYAMPRLKDILDTVKEL